MTLHEVKERIETAYNTEDWNIIEDVISALETVIMIRNSDKDSCCSFTDMIIGLTMSRNM